MRKNIVIASSVTFFLIGVAALLIGFQMTGWSIIDWLSSPYATTFFILFGIGVIILINVIFIFRNIDKWKD